MGKFQTLVSAACLLCGFLLFGMFAWSLRGGFAFPVEAYWLSFVFVSIPLLCDVFFWHSGLRVRLVYLLAFSTMIALQYAVVDVSPFLASSDAVFEFRLSEEILVAGVWSPGMSIERGVAYSYYPVTNFLYVVVSSVTGVPLVLVTKYLFIVVRAFALPLLAFKWLRSFFSENLAYLGAAILLSSPGAILFPHKEAIALIFLMVGLYVMMKLWTSRSRSYLAVGILVVPVLVIAHHFTSYIFMGILASLFLAGYLLKRRSYSPSRQYFLLSCVLFAVWTVYVAWITAGSHVDLLLEVLMPKPVVSSSLLVGYASYETVVIWIGSIITLLSAFLGFLGYVRYRNRSFNFVAITLFLAGLLIPATVFRFSASPLGLTVSHRAYEFGYFSIGPLAAFLFLRGVREKKSQMLRMLFVLVIVSVLISGIMAGDVNPRNPTPSLVHTISESALSLSPWVEDFSSEAEIIVYSVEGPVYLVLSGQLGRRVTVYPELFSSLEFNFTAVREHGISSEEVYVITHAYLFELAQLRGESLNETCLGKFEMSLNSQRLYSNGVFTIYELTLNATG